MRIDELKAVPFSRSRDRERAWFPNFRFVRITAKSPPMDDRSPLDLEAEHDVVMYDGDVPEWI